MCLTVNLHAVTRDASRPPRAGQQCVRTLTRSTCLSCTGRGMDGLAQRQPPIRNHQPAHARMRPLCMQDGTGGINLGKLQAFAAQFGGEHVSQVELRNIYADFRPRDPNLITLSERRWQDSVAAVTARAGEQRA
jgi:hypothetical protein